MEAYDTRCTDAGCIDTELKKQFDSESEYWTEVLKRVAAVVKFLSERGLPFRGHSETFGQPDNGNFMGMLEVIAEFNPFLKALIKKIWQCW